LSLSLQGQPALALPQLGDEVAAEGVDGERAAALELALEALYLAKKLDKTTGEGETVYG
jgi:magnesium chelatase subunit I